MVRLNFSVGILFFLLSCIAGANATMVGGISPKAVALHGKVPKIPGPNCFNAVLVAKEVSRSLRFANDDEIEFYLNSPLCRPLLNGEIRSAGDIGVISRIETYASISHNELVHAFIYISDKMTFAKGNFLSTDPYLITDFTSALDLYKIPQTPECRSNQGKLSESCPSTTSYYRCISLKEYRNTNPLPIDFSSFESALVKIEDWVEESTMSGQSLSESQKEFIAKESAILVQYFNEILKQIEEGALQISKNQSFELGNLYFRIEGIRRQAYWSNETNLGERMYELRPLSDKILKLKIRPMDAI